MYTVKVLGSQASLSLAVLLSSQIQSELHLLVFVSTDLMSPNLLFKIQIFRARLTGIQLLSSGAKILPFALLSSTYLRSMYLKRAQGRKTNFLIETIDGSIDSRTEATQQ
jgi:hypothetical protein